MDHHSEVTTDSMFLWKANACLYPSADWPRVRDACGRTYSDPLQTTVMRIVVDYLL